MCVSARVRNIRSRRKCSLPCARNSADMWEWFIRRLHYVDGEFPDKNLYSKLADTLKKVDHDHSTHGNYFFYMATAPDFFGTIAENLAGAKLLEENNHWRRLVVE